MSSKDNEQEGQEMQTTLDDSFFLLGAGKVSLRSYLAQANLDQLGSTSELWTIQESSHQLSYLTHNFFRFFGKFPPPVAERFIKQLHNPASGPILDPMMGSGTTLIEALRLGHASIGIDINPLFLTIAKAKTTFVEKNSIFEALNRLHDFTSIDKNLWEKYVPVDSYLDHWFFPETQRQLAILRLYIETVSSEKGVDCRVIDCLKAGFISMIRNVSRASKGIGRMFFDPGLKQVDVFSLFERKITEMSDRIEQLKNLSPKPCVLEGVSATKTGLDSNSIGLVICHPPYFNLYKYSSIYRFELLWLGICSKEFKHHEVREAFKLGKAEKVGLYVDDMAQILTEMHRVLLPGCYCALMIGDTIIKGSRVSTTSLVLDSLKKDTFKVEKVIVRVPKYTEASYAAAQRRSTSKVGIKLPDHLVLLKKM